MKLGFGPQRLDFGLEVRIWASRMGFGPQDWALGLKTGIWASRLGYGPPGWIWASRLRYGPRGWDGGSKKEEKIPHVCESLGRRPLRGRCSKMMICKVFHLDSDLDPLTVSTHNCHLVGRSE